MERRTASLSGFSSVPNKVKIIVNHAFIEDGDPDRRVYFVEWNDEEQIEDRLSDFVAFAYEWFLFRKGVKIFAVDNANVGDDSDLIIIESDIDACIKGAFLKIIDMINSKNHEEINVYIFEVKSFEDAYAIALNMRETHALCYDRNYTLN